MYPHCLANFAVHCHNETTVGSQIEILTSFARDSSSTAEHFVYTCESSIQRSSNPFRRILSTTLNTDCKLKIKSTSNFSVLTTLNFHNITKPSSLTSRLDFVVRSTPSLRFPRHDPRGLDTRATGVQRTRGEKGNSSPQSEANHRSHVQRRSPSVSRRSHWVGICFIVIGGDRVTT